MARSAEDDALTPIARHHIFKRAFDTIEFFVDSGNLIGGFILSFSILEDRVRAALVDCYRLIDEPLPTKDISSIPFTKIVSNLERIHVIDKDLLQRLKEAAIRRNELTHQMMWRLDVFKLEDIQSFKVLINDVKKYHRRFVRTHKK